MNNYEIYIKDSSGLKLFYEPSDADLGLTDIHFKSVAGGAGSLTFTIYSNHPFYREVVPLTTDFWLYKSGTPVFRGRCIGAEEDYYRTKAVTIEGDLNFLLDSIQEPYDFTGTSTQFLQRVLSSHNGSVEEKKKFTLGTVNVAGTVSIKNDGYESSIDALKKMIGILGGFLRVRHSSSVNYLDYVSDYGGENSQEISFGENLLDLSTSIEPDKVITCLYPFGASVETGTGKQRVDISSVNAGKKYIMNDAGVTKWGKIWGSVTWDNISSPSVLLSTAQRYLAEQAALPKKLSMSAVDLSLVNLDFEAFEVGKWTKVSDSEHGISGTYMLNEQDINISSPEQSTITLNGEQASMVDQTIRQRDAISKEISDYTDNMTSEMISRINNATDLITGGLGGYIYIHRTNDKPDEILIMDAPTTDSAKNVIRMNKNGIGFSNNGYNGTYRNAWTIDGNLVADFITTGTMSANRVKGGTMEVGGRGTAKDGKIAVYDANGNLIGTWDKTGIKIYSGSIQGTTITGSVISGDEIRGGTIQGTTVRGSRISGSVIDAGGGMFHAEEEEVSLGPFYVYEGRTGMYLATDDQSVGMGTSRYFAFWAGDSSDNPPFYVDGDGGVWCEDMGPDWRGYTVGRAIKWIWDNWPGE